MRALHLHARGRHRPHGGDGIDLRPAHAPNLSRPRRRQDDELQRPCRDRRARAQHGDEGRHLGVEESRVVPPAQALGARQDRLKVSTPPGGVVPAAVPGGPRRIQNTFDTAPQASCRLRLRVPDRAEGAEHHVRAHFRHRNLPQAGGLVFERLPPLPAVLGVSPHRFAVGHENFCGLSEGQRGARRFIRWGAAGLDGVHPTSNEAPRLVRPVPCAASPTRPSGPRPISRRRPASR